MDSTSDILCSDSQSTANHGGTIDHSVTDRDVPDIELVLASARALRKPTARLDSELWLDR